MKIGLGVYPTLDDGSVNPCFDPNRPWYQPYWFDTWEEEACKHARGSYVFDSLHLPGVDARLVDGGLEITGRKPSTPGETLVSVAVIGGLVALVVGVGVLVLKR